MNGSETLIIESTGGAARIKPGVKHQRNSGNYPEITEALKGRRNGGHQNRRDSTSSHPIRPSPRRGFQFHLPISQTRSFAALRSGLYSVLPSALSLESPLVVARAAAVASRADELRLVPRAKRKLRLFDAPLVAPLRDPGAE